jgi:hypothetical protein
MKERSLTPITDSLINDGKLVSGEVARIVTNFELLCGEIPTLRSQIEDLANRLNTANQRVVELSDENRKMAEKIENLHAFADLMVAEAREAME